jgi:hypothetical protein
MMDAIPFPSILGQVEIYASTRIYSHIGFVGNHLTKRVRGTRHI